MAERRLHIGGKVRVPGWEVVNIQPGPHVDHVTSARDMGRFESDSIDEIYASHVVEHFDYRDELLATLQGWRRVLRPGGRLYISVPDMDILCRMFLDRANLAADERFFVMRMMFGGHSDPYDYHQVGLNEEFLTIFLREAGFANLQRVAEFRLFPDSSSKIYKSTLISLNMIAEKPHQAAAVYTS